MEQKESFSLLTETVLNYKVKKKGEKRHSLQARAPVKLQLFASSQLKSAVTRKTIIQMSLWLLTEEIHC